MGISLCIYLAASLFLVVPCRFVPPVISYLMVLFPSPKGPSPLLFSCCAHLRANRVVFFEVRRFSSRRALRTAPVFLLSLDIVFFPPSLCSSPLPFFPCPHCFSIDLISFSYFGRPLAIAGVPAFVIAPYLCFASASTAFLNDLPFFWRGRRWLPSFLGPTTSMGAFHLLVPPFLDLDLRSFFHLPAGPFCRWLFA